LDENFLKFACHVYYFIYNIGKIPNKGGNPMKKILMVLCIVYQLLNIQTVQAQVVPATSQPLVESEIFHLINQHRATNLLPLLRWASTPAHLARKHSLDMAKGLVPFGHQGVENRYAELIRKIPSLTRFGENVAYNFGFSNPAQQAVDAWLASPGHYANIMGDYNLAGVGVAKNLKGEYYFTQIFVKANVTQLNALEGKEESFHSGMEEDCIFDPPVELGIK